MRSHLSESALTPMDVDADHLRMAAMSPKPRNALRPGTSPGKRHSAEADTLSRLAATVSLRRPATAASGAAGRRTPAAGFRMSRHLERDMPDRPATTGSAAVLRSGTLGGGGRMAVSAGRGLSGTGFGSSGRGFNSSFDAPATQATGRRQAGPWTSPANQTKLRTCLAVDNAQAPLLPNFDTRRRGVPRPKTTTLDYYHGVPMREFLGGVHDLGTSLAARAMEFRNIPAPEKEQVVAVRAAQEYHAISSKLTPEAHAEMLQAMAAPPKSVPTGALRRPTPAQATARGQIPGATGAGLRAGRDDPFRWGSTEATDAMQQGSALDGAAGSFTPMFGAGGSLGTTAAGATVLGPQITSDLRRTGPGATSPGSGRAAVTHERAQPASSVPRGTRGKLPLRKVFLEPTATAGLIAPVRSTKFTPY
ncbi:hypothetical protein FNF27_02941 [Cafeteria roenbergensis]|uniref:Uncharacterized protein n=1 Tax=Cafeteria roenbergensis TaxID=33653 RepID=A0A5A8EIE1_CAFRO|nr:hypothetical protein FNF31_02060 [Cafeteria roenbergensis]KAA0175531.1 hypothetical protein FNF27_02941 [Cafeteria roenbergensis]